MDLGGKIYSRQLFNSIDTSPDGRGWDYIEQIAV
jgi:hypothetical protein